MLHAQHTTAQHTACIPITLTDVCWFRRKNRFSFKSIKKKSPQVHFGIIHVGIRMETIVFLSSIFGCKPHGLKILREKKKLIILSFANCKLRKPKLFVHPLSSVALFFFFFFVSSHLFVMCLQPWTKFIIITTHRNFSCLEGNFYIISAKINEIKKKKVGKKSMSNRSVNWADCSTLSILCVVNRMCYV